MNNISRRKLFSYAGGAAALAASSSYGFAQTTRPLVVGVYAGVFENAVRETFAKNFTARTGVPVEFSIGGPPQWLSQVKANPQHPPVDVIMGSVRDAIREGAAGLLDPVSAEVLPNMVDIPAHFVEMCNGYGVPFDYGATGLAYNSDRISNPPKSFKEFIERTVAGEWIAAVPSIEWAFTPSWLIWSLNDVLGGTVDNIEPFMEAMQRMKPNLVSFSGLAEFVTLLESGEADIGVYPDGRTWAQHFAGSSWLRFIDPEEGSLIDFVAPLKPKNSHPAAWDFINTMLDPVEQARFAELTYNGMTNEKVVYSDRVKDIITPWQGARIAPAEAVAAATPGWVERWNRELGL